MYFQTVNPYGGYFNYEVQYEPPSTVMAPTTNTNQWAIADGAVFDQHDITYAMITSEQHGSSAPGGSWTAYGTNPVNAYIVPDRGSFEASATVYKIFTCIINPTLTQDAVVAFYAYNGLYNNIIPDFITSITVDGITQPTPPPPWNVTYNGTYQGSILMYTRGLSSGTAYDYLPAVLMQVNNGGALMTGAGAYTIFEGTPKMGIQQVSAGNIDPSACLGPDVYICINDIWSRVDEVEGIVNVVAIDPDGKQVTIPAQIIRSTHPSTFQKAYYVPGVGHLSQHHCLFTPLLTTEKNICCCHACTPFVLHRYQSSIMRHSDMMCKILPFAYWYHVSPCHAMHMDHGLLLQNGYVSEFYRTNLADTDADEWIVMK